MFFYNDEMQVRQMKERISILGCGWLGLPLGRYLVEQGFSVRGSSTDSDKFEELRQSGITPFRIALEPELTGDDVSEFLQSDILIINIPPQRRQDIVDYHQAQFAALLPALRQSSVSKVVFVSSTSVYSALNRKVTERDAHNPESPSGRALLAVEEMLSREASFRTTVLRFCGLIGYDRNPVKILGRLSSIGNAHQPVNLVHQDDCIRIICEVIRQGVWGKVFNACSPGHPSRRAYYGEAAKLSGQILPPDGEGGKDDPFKIIDSTCLEEALGYRFLVPDPLHLPS